MNILIVCDSAKLLPIVKNIISKEKFTGHLFTYASTSLQISRREKIKFIHVKKEYQKKIIGFYELILSIHCKQIFPAGLVKAIRCVNIHPGLSPFNRGWYPHVFSIIDRTPTGATIHEMDETIDHGPVIAQKRVTVRAWETSANVYNKIVEAETILLKNNIRRIIDHKYKVKKVANGNLNTSADFKKLCELNIKKRMRLAEAIDLLRALTHPPYANAFFIDKTSGRKVYVDISLKPAGHE
jgi:methionyl-tRNA formyltransferase